MDTKQKRKGSYENESAKLQVLGKRAGIVINVFLSSPVMVEKYRVVVVSCSIFQCINVEREIFVRYALCPRNSEPFTVHCT